MDADEVANTDDVSSADCETVELVDDWDGTHPETVATKRHATTMPVMTLRWDSSSFAVMGVDCR